MGNEKGPQTTTLRTPNTCFASTHRWASSSRGSTGKRSTRDLSEERERMEEASERSCNTPGVNHELSSEIGLK